MAISALSLSPSTAFAQKFEIKPTAEKKINQLPVCTENLIRVDDVVESLKLAKWSGSVSFLAVMASPFKSKLQLEAENAVLASTPVECLEAQAAWPRPAHKPWSLVLYPAVSLVSINPEGSHNHPARDPRALAQSGLSLLLALEVAPTGRATADRHGAAQIGPPDERRESASGVRREKAPVCTENLIRVDAVTESPKLAEWSGCSVSFWPSWPRHSSRSCGLKLRMRCFDISW
jgi:hypothetical protein